MSTRVNANCVLRRNLKRQPYGRCSVCTLKLSRCHAWQASVPSFGMLILALAVNVVPAGWPLRVVAFALIVLVVLEGLANHLRTDRLIYSEYVLREHSIRLERAVAEATRELGEANRALATSNLELLETDRLRATLIANVTHDLRTPLTVIKGAADNLLDHIAGALAAGQREYVEIVRDHATRLTVTVNELLASARLQAGQVEMVSELLDVQAIVQEVAAGLQTLARERRIHLEVRGEGVRIAADREKLRRAFENLISNALKFTDVDGQVVVEVTVGDDAVDVAVRDSGHGIPSAELPRLFERFYRGSTLQPGTGLGLSIARNLVRLHGGDISVVSEVGRGSE
ncbi:MAG: HAMP domain-containing sensor histidine kinase, partial [Dehalococcoidales bacterium]|nr:HAMP domain-containing sensor histidine kinase [Dehalococcoidales bacterium]